MNPNPNGEMLVMVKHAMGKTSRIVIPLRAIGGGGGNWW